MRLKEQPDQQYVDSIVEISDDLDHEFRQQPGLRSWLSGHYVRALDNARRLKNDLALLRAQLADQARQRYKNDRVTKDVIEGWVVQRSIYQAAQKKLFDAQLVEDMLSEGLRTLEHKKSALENLAANMRRDWESASREPVVRGAASFSGQKR